jgi:hypothetical protein
VSLHNAAKYCIFLKEAFDSILLTVDDVIDDHDEFFGKLHPADVTRSMLKHKRGLFKSTNLRLASLHMRTQNLINLVRCAYSDHRSRW